MDTKKVGCLYRVSTLKQVEENDIPMQRIACVNFIKNQKNWVLKKEYIELGVSGYKISQAKRDVLQEIKRDVMNEEIDILLVFMFDRIGRREEETPFVVEWLIDKGVEVWSVKEGQRKLENRADKLINYITYWQASGESEKTSIRVREAQVQMAEKGILTYGGKRNAPFGYDFVKSGTFTKKGVERQKLVVNEKEKEIIVDIFDLYVKRGYGIGKIAKYLNDKKIKPRRSKLWGTSSVNAILGNPLYMGYPAYGKKTTVNVATSKRKPFDTWILPSNKIYDLAIVDESIWYKTKEIRKFRNDKNCFNNPNNDIKPMQTKTKLLFIGLIKCGECGYAFLTGGTKKKNKNGDIVKHLYYRCSSSRFTNTCELKKKSIKKEIVEEIVLKCVYDFLDSLGKIDLSNAIKNGILNNCDNEEKELKKCEDELKEVKSNITVLKNEVIKTITGESDFSSELLNELIKEKEDRRIELEDLENRIKDKIKQKSLEDKEILQIKNKIPIWRKEFENADIDIQKMLLSEIIKEIRVFNDRYEIDFRLQLNDYIKDKIVIKENNELKYKESKLVENTISIKLEE